MGCGCLAMSQAGQFTRGIRVVPGLLGRPKITTEGSSRQLIKCGPVLTIPLDDPGRKGKHDLGPDSPWRNDEGHSVQVRPIFGPSCPSNGMHMSKVPLHGRACTNTTHNCITLLWGIGTSRVGWPSEGLSSSIFFRPRMVVNRGHRKRGCQDGAVDGHMLATLLA